MQSHSEQIVGLSKAGSSSPSPDSCDICMQSQTLLQLLAIFTCCVMLIGWFAPAGLRVCFKQRVCAISLPSKLPLFALSAVLSFISVHCFRALYIVAVSSGLLLVLLSNFSMIHWRSLMELMMADSIVVAFVIVRFFISHVEHDLSYLFGCYSNFDVDQRSLEIY